MLLDIYGGYAYMIGAVHSYATLNGENQLADYYSLLQANYQRWKVGASLHYHYRDIVELNASGNYYFWQADKVYDRPNWEVKARVDVHINSKWSIYSDNYFAGRRLAATSQGDMTLRPTISLHIGGQYAINRWLVVYAQLNDYLNRKDSFFYGYESQGIHFLVGVKYKF
jgi:hypothetical protein